MNETQAAFAAIGEQYYIISAWVARGGGALTDEEAIRLGKERIREMRKKGNDLQTLAKMFNITAEQVRMALATS